MAFMIPESIDSLPNVTPGEARVFRLLKAKLPDESIVWYDLPVRGRHTDFVVFDPRLGLLILEIKDWKAETIRAVSPTQISLATEYGEKTITHPLRQARSYAFKIAALLESVPQLVNAGGEFQGKLRFPFGYGVVWTNLKESEFRHMFGGLMDPEGMVFRDTLAPSIEPEALVEKLSELFPVRFPFELSREALDCLRWLLFPEIRLPRGAGKRTTLEQKKGETPLLEGQTFDDGALLAVMDYEQERLAKNLGDGHRLVRGVAGSGKTWTLICRARLLARLHPQWRILVLCYNATLAAHLKQAVLDDTAFSNRSRQIEVRTFHSLLRRLAPSAGIPEKAAAAGDETVTRTVTRLSELAEIGEWLPSHYDAVLVDEAHDFPSEWLRLVVSLVNPATDSLFVVYDGSQNIYRRGFSFAKVGMKVRGRTKLLRTNYRNTREIAEFAADFLGRGVRYAEDEILRDDEGQLLEIVRPATSARTGPPPRMVRCATFREECAETAAHVKLWIERDGIAPQEVLILYVKKGLGPGDDRYLKALLGALDEAGIVYEWIARDWRTKRSFSMSSPTVKVSTIHSAKGLDFDTVALVGVSLLPSSDRDADMQRKLVYIGLTRARRRLLVTWCKESAFVKDMLGLTNWVMGTESG